MVFNFSFKVRQCSHLFNKTPPNATKAYDFHTEPLQCSLVRKIFLVSFAKEDKEVEPKSQKRPSAAPIHCVFRTTNQHKNTIRKKPQNYVDTKRGPEVEMLPSS